jgi:hypothetical protein
LETYIATPLFRAAGQRNQVRLPDRTLDVQALHRHFPAVGPEGLEIVAPVWGSAEDADVARLVVAPVDGGEGREIYRPEQIHDRSFYLYGSSWADDWIAFSAGPAFAPLEAPVDIWKVRSDGAEATNLTAGSKANDAWPDYSSDGGRTVRFLLGAMAFVLALCTSVPAAAADIEIVNVYDAFGIAKNTQQHFGFSAVVKQGDLTILFDSGADADVFAANLKALGVDPKEIDIAAASHNHADHISGFDYLLEVNPDVRLYLPHDFALGAPVKINMAGTDSSIVADLPRGNSTSAVISLLTA